MEQGTDRKFANTLARGIAILQVFRASDDGLSHADIAARTGLPKATISRLTYTLCALGYLSHGGRNDRFRLGPAAFVLGSIATLSTGFVDQADETMQRLADQTGTLALIALQDGARMLLAKTWRPAGQSTIWLNPGQHVPLFGSSSGMAVLAAMSEARFERLPEHSDWAGLRQDGYEQLLERGFVVVEPSLRYSKSVNAVSVPYHAAEFGSAVAFSCGGLPSELTDHEMTKHVGPALRDAVRALEQRTGQAPALARRG